MSVAQVSQVFPREPIAVSILASGQTGGKTLHFDVTLTMLWKMVSEAD